MKRVLITGASGLLGSEVVRTLATSGWDVVGTYHTDASHNWRSGIELIRLDLTTDEGWRRLPNDLDAVVHCAAYVPEDFSDWSHADYAWRVNGLGTLKLLAWARERGVRRFIYCSSHSIYRRPLTVPIKEEQPVYPGPHATSYAVSKLAGEAFAVSMHEDHFLVSSLRLSSLYGAPLGRSGVVFSFVTLAQNGQPITITSPPETRLDLLYVNDAANAVRLCLDATPRHAIYNIGAGKGTKLQSLAEACNKVFESPTSVQIRQSTDAPQHVVLDISRAREELGYEPAFDILSGLRHMKRQITASP